MFGASDRLFRTLRDHLIHGRYGLGSRLPSERALAKTHGVNRGTVRSVIGRLAALGLVTVRRGDGIRAAGPRETASFDLVAHLLEAGVGDAGRAWDVVADLLTVRRVLAEEAIALACHRATPKDLASLAEIAASQARLVDDPEAFATGDAHFARTLLQIAGNVVMEILFNNIERFFRARPDVHSAMLAHPAHRVADYHAVIALIAQGEVEPARRAVHQAMTLNNTDAMRRLTERAKDDS